MSAFYDLASLVLVPSGYKASKVYAQKPLTTDGQLTFSRSTTATRVNSAGLIEEVAANVPRLDYAPTLGQSGVSCPRLLLEPQRTNVALYSEQLNNAYYNGSSVTANATASPDGYTNADAIVEGSGATTPVLQFVTTLPVGGSTQSVFAKMNGRRYLLIGNNANTSFLIRFCCFDLQTGTVVANDISEGTPKIEDYGNGWYRCSVNFSNSLNIARAFEYRVNNIASATPTSYTGDGASGLFLYGSQVEAGSYVSSYIPTLGAAVTRGADASYKTSVSGLIGQTEGTLYAEVQNNSIGSTSGSDNVVLSIEGANNNSTVAILYQPLGDVLGIVFLNGTAQAIISYNAGLTTSPKKIALAYKNNDCVLYVDGVLRGTDTSASIPTCSNIGLGNYYNGNSINVINSKIVNQALVFKTRLTNAQLAELTAL